MTLIIETGAGPPDADSYASVATLGHRGLWNIPAHMCWVKRHQPATLVSHFLCKDSK